MSQVSQHGGEFSWERHRRESTYNANTNFPYKNKEKHKAWAFLYSICSLLSRECLCVHAGVCKAFDGSAAVVGKLFTEHVSYLV